MNNLWMGMIFVGILYGAFSGNLQAVPDAAFASAKEAVQLSVTMAGVMALWMGVMEIAKGAGLLEIFSKRLRPCIKFLFPEVPQGHKAQEYIAANMIANILGLGSAATPAGLKAMKELARLKKESGLAEETASKTMCNFLILNISSLQLIPVSIIAYRSQYGSVNPAAVTGPAILATFISTAAAILFCKIMENIVCDV